MTPTPTPSAPFVSQPTAPPPTVLPQKSVVKKAAAWLVGAVILLIGGGLRQIGLSVAHNPQQAVSSLQNPFGPRPLATSLRLFQQGDSWDYRVSGTVSLSNGRTATITDGTMRSEMTGFNAGGDFKTLTEEDTVSLTASADGKTLPFSRTTRQTLSQDWLKADTSLLSDDNGPQGALRTVRQSRVDTPGTWSLGTIQSVHLDFDDSESRDETTTVQGSEVVDTALGRVTAWRCVQEQTDSDGTHSTTTLWFAPQIGMPVKTSGTFTLPSGTVMNLNTDITETSVPL